MRILRKGYKKENLWHQGHCSNCGTVVEFQRKEATVVPDDRGIDYLTVPCPTCQHPINSYLKLGRPEPTGKE